MIQAILFSSMWLMGRQVETATQCVEHTHNGMDKRWHSIWFLKKWFILTRSSDWNGISDHFLMISNFQTFFYAYTHWDILDIPNKEYCQLFLCIFPLFILSPALCLPPIFFPIVFVISIWTHNLKIKQLCRYLPHPL